MKIEVGKTYIGSFGIEVTVLAEHDGSLFVTKGGYCSVVPKTTAKACWTEKPVIIEVGKRYLSNGPHEPQPLGTVVECVKIVDGQLYMMHGKGLATLSVWTTTNCDDNYLAAPEGAKLYPNERF